MNSVCILGRVCADPVIRKTGKSGKVADVTLAVDRQLSQEVKEKAKQTADFIRCNAWGTKADLAQKYLKKGDKIGADGKIRTSSYEKLDGQKVYSTVVSIDNFYFLEKSRPKESEPKKSDIGLANVFSAEDLPF